MRSILVFTTAALGFAGVLAAGASAQPASPASQPAPPPTAGGDSVAVTVNGHPITEADVETMFTNIVQQRSGGRTPPEAMLARAREQMRPQIVQALIDARLLDAEVKRAGITVSPEELRKEMEEGLEGHLLRSNTTREEFEQQLQTQMNMSLPEFLAKRAAEPQYIRSAHYTRLLEQRSPQELSITAEQINARYERDKDKVYAQPETVKASHILLSTEPTATDTEKQAARKKAEEILAEARKPEADFAALAQQHSTCPSKTQGGDLGFFPRTGRMVEPFAAAAFALQTGEISEFVETQFGYHIKMVTDRKEATVMSLEQAEEALREQLRAEKVAELRAQHLAELKKSAKIVYPTSGESPQGS